MKPSIILGERDRSALSALFHHQLPGLIPHPQAYESLRGFISSAGTTHDEATLDCHVGLGDLVILGSPRRSRGVRIVLPEDARGGTELVSVLSPLGLSLLGRKVGSELAWSCSTGPQKAVIREVQKDASTLPQPR